MSDMMTKLGIKVDSSGAEHAIDTLERLERAAKLAEHALLSLGDLAHKGITIEMMGDLVRIEVYTEEDDGSDD